MRYTMRPLRWGVPSTPEDQRRSRWTFRAGWQDTLDLLERELEHLDAVDVVIEADFSEGDLRLDGMPRANARQPSHPGVRIAFESKHGPLVYATDSCAFWQQNVRSIGLGLEALRAVDRYGVTKRGEQYSGWAAIGSTPFAMPATAVASLDEAWAVLRDLARLDEHEPANEDRVINLAQRQAHPDRGGSTADWARFKAAHRVIRPQHRPFPS